MVIKSYLCPWTTFSFKTSQNELRSYVILGIDTNHGLSLKNGSKDRPWHVSRRRTRVRHVPAYLCSLMSEPYRVTCPLRKSTWIWAHLALSETCKMIMGGDAMYLRNGTIGVSKIIRNSINNSRRENFIVMFNWIEMVNEKWFFFWKKLFIPISCLPCAAVSRWDYQNLDLTCTACLGFIRKTSAL